MTRRGEKNEAGRIVKISYAMGSSDAETARLQLQSELYASHTAHLLRLAGLRPGHRVIDVGCGAGDVAMEAARLVGPGGSVLAVDQDPALIEVTARRAADSGLGQIRVGAARLPDLDGLIGDGERFDAVIGRLILLHLPDPVQTVKRLVERLDPGGIVTFQDFATSRARSVPATPLFERAIHQVIAALAHAGVDADAGDHLVSIFRAAGLPSAQVAMCAPGGGDSTSLVLPHVAATVSALRPLVLASGTGTEAEPEDADTLTERLRAEQRAAGSVVFGPNLIAAWSRLPG